MAVSSYIICATPRSGSTLLCDLLVNTGVAGRPASFYRRQSIPRWAQRLDVPMSDLAEGAEFDRPYLAAVLREGAGSTGTFGLRLMWENVEELSQRLDALYPDLPNDAARFQEAFENPLYVHLTRQDKIAQAVSRLKAEQSGLWHLSADGSERERTAPPQAPVYDADRLAALVAELNAHDAAWEDWFTQQQIKPLRLNYEAVSANPKLAIEAILSALGRDTAIAATIEAKTAKMADNESTDWAARFRRERGDLTA